jgi:hypothetical protein
MEQPPMSPLQLQLAGVPERGHVDVDVGMGPSIVMVRRVVTGPQSAEENPDVWI